MPPTVGIIASWMGGAIPEGMWPPYPLPPFSLFFWRTTQCSFPLRQIHSHTHYYVHYYHNGGYSVARRASTLTADTVTHTREKSSDSLGWPFERGRTNSQRANIEASGLCDGKAAFSSLSRPSLHQYNLCPDYHRKPNRRLVDDDSPPHSPSLPLTAARLP